LTAPNGPLSARAGSSPAPCSHPCTAATPRISAGGPNFARFWFLDEAARDFIGDWDSAANVTAAQLRAEAGRYPDDKALREFIGELSTVSAEFRTRWATHSGRIRHGGVKVLNHPDAGPLELTYQPLDLPISSTEAHPLIIYTAQPRNTSDAQRY
jgi:hypothetical protein